MSRSALPACRPPVNAVVPGLERKALAKVKIASLFTGHDVLGGSGQDDLPLNHEVGSVADMKGFPDVMVGNQYADSPFTQGADQPLNVSYGQRVDARERLVE